MANKLSHILIFKPFFLPMKKRLLWLTSFLIFTITHGRLGDTTIIVHRKFEEVVSERMQIEI